MIRFKSTLGEVGRGPEAEGGKKSQRVNVKLEKKNPHGSLSYTAALLPKSGSNISCLWWTISVSLYVPSAPLFQV